MKHRLSAALFRNYGNNSGEVFSLAAIIDSLSCWPTSLFLLTETYTIVFFRLYSLYPSNRKYMSNDDLITDNSNCSRVRAGCMEANINGSKYPITIMTFKGSYIIIMNKQGKNQLLLIAVFEPAYFILLELKDHKFMAYNKRIYQLTVSFKAMSIWNYA